MQRDDRVKDASEYSAEVLDFAVHLGMDPNVDVQHLWMAEECLMSALPAPWTEHTSSRCIFLPSDSADPARPQQCIAIAPFLPPTHAPSQAP